MRGEGSVAPKGTYTMLYFAVCDIVYHAIKHNSGNRDCGIANSFGFITTQLVPFVVGIVTIIRIG
jgi:hypothetical protein